MLRCCLCVGWLLVSAVAVAAPLEKVPNVGPWHAWLDSPGGKLPFGLEIARDGEAWRAWLINGPERIEVPHVTWRHTSLTLDIDYYDSRVTAQLSDNGKRLDGQWRKRGRGNAWTEMAFHAVAGPSPRFPYGDATTAAEVSGRWSVRFSSSDEPAVGIFDRHEDGTVTGTFMTTTGDYRYLAGSMDGNRLRLSCFDGAHAFLFDARLLPDGTFSGDFWSRDSWHESWTARRDAVAALPDSFALTKWSEGTPLKDVSFPDADGRKRSLNDPAFGRKARMIVVFGTWCPNCHDATKYLVELDRRYHPRGLRILGLAFELTGDFERDARQVRTYAARHGVTYPMLIAGTADKHRAAEALPFLDNLKAYPTTIFLDADGQARAVYTGFSGPATGKAHQRLRRDFESVIEELLSAPSGP